MKKFVSSLMTVLFAGGLVCAQEARPETSSEAEFGRLAVNIGAAYRNFPSTRFKSTSLPAFKGVFPQSGLAGNVVEYNTGIDKVGVDSLGNEFQDVAVVVHQSDSSFAGSDSPDFSECLGPAIGISYDFWQKNRLTLAATASFQYYSQDAKSGAGRDAGTEYSTYQTVLPGLPPAPERDSHDTDYLTARGKAKFEMDLYAFDLGLRLDYAAVDSLFLFAAVGPTLALADMESSSSTSLIRRLDGTRLAGQTSRDSSQDWIFGVYASCGAAFWFNERIGASLEIRYDEAFNHASTKDASQNLDSFGGLLKVITRF